jgi:hypothetical protein
MIGITSMTIHSGLLPDSRKASTIFRRLASFFFLGLGTGGLGFFAQFHAQAGQINLLRAGS